MSKKSIFMMLAVFVAGIAAVLFLPKSVWTWERCSGWRICVLSGKRRFNNYLKENNSNNIEFTPIVKVDKT